MSGGQPVLPLSPFPFDYRSLARKSPFCLVGCPSEILILGSDAYAALIDSKSVLLRHANKHGIDSILTLGLVRPAEKSHFFIRH